MIRAAFAAAVMASAFIFSACSSGGDNAPEFESQPLSPELQAMLDEVAEIRGLPSPTNIRIGAIPRDRVAEFIDSRYSEADRAELDHLTLLYRLQGHLSSTQDFREVVLQLFTDFGIGFYSPEDRTMWLVRDSIEPNPANLDDGERSTLAHEFVHAIQDNAFDIERIEAETSAIDDGALAHAAVIEGDAVAHERLWLEADLAAGGMQAVLFSTAQASIPPSLERELRFPYEAGLDWVAAIRAASGQQPIDAILRERRPLTTAEIMHPTIRDTGWTPEEVLLPDVSSGLGDGWARSTEGVLGEFRLANYLQLWLPSLEALGAAQGWTGDRFALYANGESTAAVFRAKYFDPKDAGEFAQAHLRLLRQSGATIEETTTGTTATYSTGRTVIQLRDTASDEVIFAIGSTPEAATAIAGLLLNI